MACSAICSKHNETTPPAASCCPPLASQPSPWSFLGKLGGAHQPDISNAQDPFPEDGLVLIVGNGSLSLRQSCQLTQQTLPQLKPASWPRPVSSPQLPDRSQELGADPDLGPFKPLRRLVDETLQTCVMFFFLKLHNWSSSTFEGMISALRGN